MRGRPRMEQVRVGHARTGAASRLDRRPVRCRRLLLMAVVSAAVAGCSSGGHVGIGDSAHATSPSATASPSSSPPPSARDQVLSQYRAFWAHLTQASLVPAAQRSPLLSPYAVDPELSSLLRGMESGDRKGTVFYGQDVPRPSITSLSVAQGLAVIRDCQDSSKAGNAVRRTGRKLTVGVARHLVISTMHLTDGAWRVAFVTYEQSKC